MKTFILSLSIILFSTISFAAPFLVCDDPDPAEQVTSYECFQDGVSLGITAAPLNYDLSGITPGQYSFTCKAINAWGVSSASDPYISPASASKPLNVNMTP